MKGGAIKMVFKEINPLSWIYEKDGDCIEGILVKVQDNVGVNKSFLYHIETTQGIKSVWGATILDSRMALVPVGSKLKITYKGLAEAKKGKNPAKVFKVEVDKDYKPKD